MELFGGRGEGLEVDASTQLSPNLPKLLQLLKKLIHPLKTASVFISGWAFIAIKSFGSL